MNRLIRQIQCLFMIYQTKIKIHLWSIRWVCFHLSSVQLQLAVIFYTIWLTFLWLHLGCIYWCVYVLGLYYLLFIYISLDHILSEVHFDLLFCIFIQWHYAFFVLPLKKYGIYGIFDVHFIFIQLFVLFWYYIYC